MTIQYNPEVHDEALAREVARVLGWPENPAVPDAYDNPSVESWERFCYTADAMLQCLNVAGRLLEKIAFKMPVEVTQRFMVCAWADSAHAIFDYMVAAGEFVPEAGA